MSGSQSATPEPFTCANKGSRRCNTPHHHFYDIQIRASSYYSLALFSLLAVGLVFELPVFILGLVRFGVLSAKKLRSHRRIGYVTMAVIAVALPGVDPITTLFEMVPLMLLFEGSIWLAVVFERRWHPELRAVSAAN